MMTVFPSRLAGATLSVSLVLFVCIFSSYSVSTGFRTLAKEHSTKSKNSSAANTVDLKDYGAVGDGLADDGPALQQALDALAETGGGTLNVPAGQFRLATPVSKEFAKSVQLTIKGVPSLTPIVVAGNGKGLNLTSEFIIAVGETHDAITLKGFDSFLLQDIAFVGVVTEINDARVVIELSDISHVTIHHCEFYGLSSLVGGGAIISAHRTNFTLQQTAFLGCSTNSAGYSPVVLITSWLGILVRDCKFIDYGEKPNFFSKTPLQPPYSWILVGDVVEPEPAHSRREVIMDNLFLDEGGYFELAIRPDLLSIKHVPYDVYLSRLNVNVNNLYSDGVYIFGAKRVFIDRSRFGWSQRAGFAITLSNVGDAILDLIETFVDATRMRASAKRLTVINSTFTSIDSTGPVTKIITTETPEQDPAQYVRQRYLSVTNHDPDAAGHFYWTDKILRCEADNPCVNAAHADLEAYLNSLPPANVSVRGKVVDQIGMPLSGVIMSLTGSQSIAMQTNPNGEFGFDRLATAGEYQITLTKDGYSFPGQTLVRPTADVVANFVGTAGPHTISGRVTTNSGKPIEGAVLTMSGDAHAVRITDSQGAYRFQNLPLGGNYTITVSRDNYAFDVSSRSFSNLPSDQTCDFSGVLLKYTIFGTVRKPDGTVLSGASVTISNTSSLHVKTTDEAGNYSFTVDGDTNYVVNASFANYIFIPASHTFNKLSANLRADFSSVQAITISVRVTTDTGQRLNGALVSMTGSEMKSLETNSNGDVSFVVAAEGSYEITTSRPHYTFSPASIVVSNANTEQFLNFTATLVPTVPILVSTEDPTRALAFDAVLRTTEPFDLSYQYPWSDDPRTRLVLFVTNIDLSVPQSHEDLIVEFEDASGRIYPLTVEHAGPLEEIETMNRVIVRLNDELTDLGDVLVRVTYKGLTSQPLHIAIGHIGP